MYSGEKQMHEGKEKRQRKHLDRQTIAQQRHSSYPHPCTAVRRELYFNAFHWDAFRIIIMCAYRHKETNIAANRVRAAVREEMMERHVTDAHICIKYLGISWANKKKL